LNACCEKRSYANAQADGLYWNHFDPRIGAATTEPPEPLSTARSSRYLYPERVSTTPRILAALSLRLVRSLME